MAKHRSAVVGFITLFAATCAVVRHVVPSHAVILSEKMAYISDHVGQQSVLFVGSSHVYRQLIPKTFDAEFFAATGQKTKSFNLGAPALSLPEAFELLDRAFSMGGAHFDWIFVDTSLFSEVTQDNLFTRRDLDWHSARETLLACKYLLRSKDTLPERLDKARDHVRAYLLNLFGTGRIAEHLRYALDADRLLDQEDLFYSVEDDGYRSLESETSNLYHERGRAFRAKVEEGATFTAPPKKRGRSSTDHYRAKMFSLIVDLAGRHGVRVAFFDPPRISGLSHVLELERGSSQTDPTFDFDDPERFASLYDLRLWFDSGHLNREGSEKLTALLASRFAAYIGSAGAIR